MVAAANKKKDKSPMQAAKNQCECVYEIVYESEAVNEHLRI